MFAGSCCRLEFAKKNKNTRKIKSGDTGQIFDLFEIFNNLKLGNEMV